MRIVSLLPSATEIICSIGLRDSLVGVTHECDYPADVTGLPVVTRSLIRKDLPSQAIDEVVRDQLKTVAALYDLELDTLEKLAPDLIVTQALCDVCAVPAEQVFDVACRLPGRPKVINLEPSCFEDVLQTLLQVGREANRLQQAEKVMKGLLQRIDTVAGRSRKIPRQNRPKTALLEWIDPLFDAGHWTPELIEIAGGIPCFGEKNQRSRGRSWDELVAAQPEALFVCLCGFDTHRSLQDVPLLLQQPAFNDLPAAQSGRVYLLDGNQYFSRPGPRLVDSVEIMAHALHPTSHPLPQGMPSAVKLV